VTPGNEASIFFVKLVDGLKANAHSSFSTDMVRAKRAEMVAKIDSML
jgi:hypothetical protein